MAFRAFGLAWPMPVCAVRVAVPVVTRFDAPIPLIAPAAVPMPASTMMAALVVLRSASWTLLLAR